MFTRKFKVTISDVTMSDHDNREHNVVVVVSDDDISADLHVEICVMINGNVGDPP